MNQIKDAVNDALENVLNESVVGRPGATHLADELGIDSTEMVDIEVALERTLGITLTPGTLSNRMSIAELCAALAPFLPPEPRAIDAPLHATLVGATGSAGEATPA